MSQKNLSKQPSKLSNINKIINKSVYIIYFVVAITISYFLMGNILFDLNQMQLDRSGDGFKNYFSFAYQYKYGDYSWFTGMQYPYGDLLSYADGQPSLLIIFKLLRYIGIDISGYELFVVQSFPILGLFIASIFLHKILRRLDQTLIWTLITVVACLALSPQLFRFNSHFGLAYVFCFPSILYLCLKNQDKEISNIFLITIGSLIILFYGFLHPYHLLICCLFLMGLFGVGIFYKKLDWHYLVTGIIPVVLFLLINSQLDPYLDRTLNPWGAWHYKTEGSDLLPFYGWFKSIFQNNFTLRNDYNEGYSYLGILIFVIPVIWIAKLTSLIPKFNRNKKLDKYILTACFLFLFSMGIHMYITSQEINDWIPPLKQFRALGRFSWPFYYVAFIALSIYFKQSISKLKSNKLKSGIFVFVIVLWFIDFHSYTKFFNKKIDIYKYRNELYENKRLLNAINNTEVNINNFQAVLPLPVPTEGAEKFSPQDNWFVKIETMPFTFQTGIPIIGGYMSRMSQSRILKQYQFSCSEYIEKEAISDLKSDKDFLIVIHKEDTLRFSDIIQKAYTINETKENMIYGISVEAISRTKSIHKPDTVKEAIYYNDYTIIDSQGMLSKGTLNINEPTIICELNTDTLVGQTLDFSMWYRIDVDKSNSPLFSIKTFDANNNETSAIDYNDKSMKRMEVIGKWVRLKMTHNIPQNAQVIKWSVKADHLSLDHALITLKQDSFYHPLNDGFAILNHTIGKTITD